MKNKYGCWGLSLSLKPPITHLDQKPMCKREPQFSTEMKPRPLVIDLEEAEIAKVSSPNSTISSTASGKRFGGSRGEKDANSDEDDGGNSGDFTGDNDRRTGERKKLRLSKEQITVLEQAFREHTTLNTKQKLALATQVNLRPRQVEVWFQNRRARTKLKQTEVDCENLRRFCETLLEDNRKLQKELQDIRVLKSSPDNQSLMMQANHIPTALAMCPSCKNVSISTSTTTTTAAAKTPVGDTSCYSTCVFHRPAAPKEALLVKYC
ncbi:hypothetical protein Cgig2_014058 [Carnegiea gigantea]|uniref:Homeobox domain-containing protein n=1 Tax=Carnegiea gigantea TaxID=171969 RepID=A0A9Q1KUS5_9CARY|nr:hypothetical protein Cgig2_014058 [Carnegiea gigantea]